MEKYKQFASRNNHGRPFDFANHGYKAIHLTNMSAVLVFLPDNRVFWAVDADSHLYPATKEILVKHGHSFTIATDFDVIMADLQYFIDSVNRPKGDNAP